MDIFLIINRTRWNRGSVLNAISNRIERDDMFRRGGKFAGYTYQRGGHDWFRIFSPQGRRPRADVDILYIQDYVRTCANKTSRFCRQYVYSLVNAPCACRFGTYLANCPADPDMYVQYVYGRNWRVPSKLHSWVLADGRVRYGPR